MVLFLCVSNLLELPIGTGVQLELWNWGRTKAGRRQIGREPKNKDDFRP